MPPTDLAYHVHLQASLQAHNAAFTSLLQLIPAQFYLAAEDDDDGNDRADLSSKYLKNKRKQSAKQVEAHERKEKIRQAKKAKLNPDNFQTVLDVQAERRQRAEVELELDDFQGEAEAEAAGDTDEDLVDSDHEPGPSQPLRLGARTEGERIEALRARLHARIQGLQRSRKTGPDARDDDDADSTISSRDDLLEERRRKRGEMRDRRRRERKQARRAAAISHPSPAPNTNRSQPLLPVPNPPPSKPTNTLAFNALQLPGAAPKKKNKLALPSDPKAALAALQARKTPIEKWDKALAAAEGIKIRDDEKLLRKSIKRKEKAKEKSAKAWAERSKTEKESQAARQKKRNENIAARKAASSTQAKKKGKAQITNKARPGFEGKKLGAKRK